MKKIDELRLIAQCALGDSRQAFGQLVEAYQSQLRRFLMNLTSGDEALTDDLAQETFLKAYVNVRNFKGLSSFATWLYRIAYNELRHHHPVLYRRPAHQASGSNRLDAREHCQVAPAARQR